MSEIRKRSQVWLHFTNLSNEKAKCNFCGASLSYKGGSTSNLKKHIQAKHPTIDLDEGCASKNKVPETEAVRHESVQDPGNSLNTGSNSEVGATIPSSSDPSSIAPIFSKRINQGVQEKLTSYIVKPVSIVRQKKIDNLISKIVLKDLQPMSIVEDEGFWDLLKFFEPSYSLPSRK